MKPAGQIKQQHSRRALFCTTTPSARLMGAHKCTELLFFFPPPWEMFIVFKRFRHLLYVGFWHFYFSLNFPYVYQWAFYCLTVGYIVKQSHFILSSALLTIYKVNPTGSFFFFLTDAPFSQIFFFSCKSWAIPRAGKRNLVFPPHVLSFQAALAGAALSVSRFVSTVTTASLPVIESSSLSQGFLFSVMPLFPFRVWHFDSWRNFSINYAEDHDIRCVLNLILRRVCFFNLLKSIKMPQYASSHICHIVWKCSKSVSTPDLLKLQWNNLLYYLMHV